MLVCPDWITPGLAERVHVGATPPLLDDDEVDDVLELVLELLLELLLLPDG